MNESLQPENLFSRENLRNLEQCEALQNALNERNELLSKADEQYARELKAVGGAQDILVKAGVPAFIFPFMKTESEKKTIHVFHNFGSFTSYKNDRLDKESARLMVQINHSFATLWFHFLVNSIMGIGKTKFSWPLFVDRMIEILKAEDDWRRNDIEFEEVKSWKESE
jgi:hypothetical protein